MLYCKCDCAYLSIIAGIIAGVILGILYSFGFVATGIIFWLYLAIGVAGIFFSPLYAARGMSTETGKCFCTHRRLTLLTSVGTIIAATVGLILAATASTIIIAIILGLATAFTVGLLVSLICLARCVCDC